MTLKWPFKDPDEVLDYGIDWTARLAGDTIQSSTWIVPDGITKVSDSSNDTSTEIWLSGGTLGAALQITNRVVTHGARTMDQSVTLLIKSK
jgi:hypothetical protein